MICGITIYSIASIIVLGMVYVITASASVMLVIMVWIAAIPHARVRFANMTNFLMTKSASMVVMLDTITLMKTSMSKIYISCHVPLIRIKIQERAMEYVMVMGLPIVPLRMSEMIALLRTVRIIVHLMDGVVLNFLSVGACVIR